MLASDFNETLCGNEEDGGSSFDFRRVRKFRDFANECGVMDYSSKDCFYIQMNGRGCEDFV